MDDEALRRTLTTGRCTYWSRSRREYWVKGETSGHQQWVKSVALDCDADTVLVKVDQIGAACHTGDRTCFDADVLDAVVGSPASSRQQTFRRTRGDHVTADVSAGPVGRVTRRLLADGETAVGLYRKLAQDRPGTFLLESAEHGRSWSRYSFIGVRAAATLTERDGQALWIGTPPPGVPTEGTPLDVLAGTVAALRGPRDRRCRRSPAAWSASSPTTPSAGSRRCPTTRSTICSCPSWSCCWSPILRCSTITTARSC